jgi:hypothetical protein
MTLINTEEGAKRLARVILSDIELYSRERPRAGESLAAQIEEGRRLFGTRVEPAIIPLFDVVLADRRAASDKTPALVPAVAQASHPAVAAVAAGNSPEDPGPTPGPAVLPQVQVEAQPLSPSQAKPDDRPLVAAAVAQASPVASVPARVPAPIELASAAVVTPLPAAPSIVVAPPVAPWTDAPVPVLTTRISIAKVVALVIVVAASAFVFLGRFLR